MNNEQKELIENLVFEMQERLFEKGMDLKGVIVETTIKPKFTKHTTFVHSALGTVEIKDTEIQVAEKDDE